MRAKVITFIVVSIIRLIVTPLLAMVAYNEIALGFNFPQFDFWVFGCIALVIYLCQLKVTIS